MEISGGGGGEKPDFSRSGNVALCLFTSKAMAVLRWSSSPREQAHYMASKQSYGCFEMVSSPRKQLNWNAISKAKSLNLTCSPFPTAKVQHRIPPTALWLQALRKLRAKTKWDSENFKPKQTATKFSANIISALFYLFVEIFLKRLKKAKNLLISKFIHPKTVGLETMAAGESWEKQSL